MHTTKNVCYEFSFRHIYISPLSVDHGSFYGSLIDCNMYMSARQSSCDLILVDVKDFQPKFNMISKLKQLDMTNKLHVLCTNNFNK